jgi:ethanolamine utilization protein EutN
MDMAIVIGSVVATEKDPSFVGDKLAIIQPIDERGDKAGEPMIANDPDARCGLGEVVYWVGGGDACKLGNGKVTPSDAAIVGLVDYHSARSELRSLSGGIRRFRKIEHDARQEAEEETGA